MHRITIKDFLDFQFVSAPQFSPDGNFAAFIIQRIDQENNRYLGDLWVLDVSNNHIRRLTQDGSVKSYYWTPSGKLLYSPSNADKKESAAKDTVSQWYQISPLDGETQTAFTLPFPIKSLKCVDEDHYIITATFDNKKSDDDLSPADCHVIEEAPFWFNGVGFTDGKRTRLYLYTRSTGECTPITAPWFDVSGYSLRGSRLLYKGLEWKGVKCHTNYPGCYLYDLETGENRCILPSDTIRSGIIAFWKDDSALITASDGNTHGLMQYLDFYTLDLHTGNLKLLQKYEASIGSGTVGTDARLGGGQTMKVEDGKFYFLTTIGSSTYLRWIDSEGHLSENLTPEGSCDSFDVFADKILSCSFHGNQLAELYINQKQVTFYNQEWTGTHSISTPEPHCFTDKDGFSVRGWALKPVDYTPGKKYPAILHIHGGPRTVFGEIYHHEMQLWANSGYFVFYCNPRGSDGYGNDFGDVGGKYGTVDYENIMQFTDEMLQKYPDADSDRIGVTGGSYGGFMTNWIIGHTDRFRAAVSQRSIANWVAFEHTSDIGISFTVSNQRTNTRSDAAKLWWHSPLKYADRCTTPTLFIHSDADYRCWIVDGLSMFTALKMNGCESRLCLFKNENHDLSRSGKPNNRIRRMEEILKWMDNHLKA